MQFLTQFFTFLADAGLSSGLAYLGVGICCLAPAFCCLGQGMAAAKACEAVARQPEVSGKITVTMIIGQAVTETGALYGFIMAILLLNK